MCALGFMTSQADACGISRFRKDATKSVGCFVSGGEDVAHAAEIVGDHGAVHGVGLHVEALHAAQDGGKFRKLARRIPVLTADSGRPYAPRRVDERARYEVPTPFELEARSARIARVLAFSA